MLRSVALVGAVGGLIATGVYIANLGNSPMATSATASGITASAALMNRFTSTAPGTNSQAGSPRGAWGRGFGRHERGGLVVTALNGNTLTVAGRGGRSMTVTVSSGTTYVEADAPASLSDVHKGSTIALRGTRTTSGGFTATTVTIVLPQQGGVVASTSGDTITVTGFDGASHTVHVSASTRYTKAGATAALSDISTGQAIEAEGTLNSDGSLEARLVTIQLPRVGGRISAISGSSITVAGRFGQNYTVTTSSSTSYVNPDGARASTSALKVGAFVMAEGVMSGNSLAAQRIVVLPAGMVGERDGRFGGGRHGFGGFGVPGGHDDDSNAQTSGSAPAATSVPTT